MRWFLADLKTGRQILDLPVLSGRWARFLNAPETLTATLDMRDPDTIALRPRVAAAPARTILAVADGDTVIAAGPIWAHDWDLTAKTLELTAVGLWSYYDHRYVLPVAAGSAAVTSFIIPDTSAAGKTKPNPALGTNLTNLEYGTIAKRWVQQAHAWTGGSVPVVFETDRTGTRERNIEGAEFKNLGTVLSQLTEVEHGPDIVFQPRLTADRLGIEFVMRTGTEAKPQLSGATVFQWSPYVPESGISDFRVKTDASTVAGLAWFTGGRSGDSVLVGRSFRADLTNAGYPLYELLDSSHSSVSIQGTLNDYASEATTLGVSPVEEVEFSVETNQQPYLGSFWEGDFCDLDIAAYDETTGTGDPYFFEKVTSRQRITGLSGDEKGLTVKVTCAPVRA